MGWCPNFYVSHLYNNETFTVLQPANLIDCYKVAEKGYQDKIEGFLILEICMYGILLLLGVVGYCSTHAKSLDFYRLFGFYSVATISVPLSLRLSPYYVHPGFNKLVGFGILIHNLAEVIILFNVWFGAVNSNALPVILYIWIFTLAEMFMPLDFLFFFGMFQGAFFDFLLVATFFNIGDYSRNQNDTKYLKKTGRKCHLCMGFGAAVLHITSILPLFFSFSTLGGQGAYTVIFLAPTFILYFWFSSADKTAAPNLFRPISKLGGVYDKTEYELFSLKIDENELTRRKSKSQNDEQSQNGISATYEEFDDEKNALINDKDRPKSVSYDVEKYDKKMEKQDVRDIDIATQFNFILLVNKGLMRIDNPWAKKRLKCSLLFAFIIDAAICPLVFLAPCFWDLKNGVCDK